MSYSLNRLDQRTHAVIFGYVRKGLELTSCPTAMHKISDFICIILSYINDHFIIQEYGGNYSWSIDTNLIIDILTSHSNKQYNSDPFVIGRITWKVIGYAQNNNFQLCLKPIITPNEWHRVLINASLYCLETLSGDTRIYGFDKDTLHLMKGPGCLSFKDIKNRNKLTNFIDIQILQVSSRNNKMLYQHQNSYKIDALQSVLSTEWGINDIQLNEMKKSHPGKCFISGIFNNMFCLRIFPNGYNYNESSSTVIIELQWIGLPPILCSKSIHWRIHCKGTDILTNNVHKFNYNQSFAIWGDNVLTFEQFKLFQTFIICLEIEIKENNECKTNGDNMHINELLSAPPYHPQIVSNEPVKAVKYHGVLVKFNEILNFGFIECDDDNIEPHLYVHFTEFRFNKRLLYKGMRLQFDIEISRNYNINERDKKRAINVELEAQQIQIIDIDNESNISHITSTASATAKMQEIVDNLGCLMQSVNSMDFRVNEMQNNMTDKFNILQAKQSNDMAKIEKKMNAMIAHFSEQLQNVRFSLNINQKILDKKISILQEKSICKHTEIKNMKTSIKYLKQCMDGIKKENNRNNNGDDNETDEKEMSQFEKIRNWFTEKVNLPQYFQLFINNGYDDMGIILDINDEDLMQIGINKIGHRKQILKCINILQNNEEDTDIESIFNSSEMQQESSLILSSQGLQQTINDHICSKC